MGSELWGWVVLAIVPIVFYAAVLLLCLLKGRPLVALGGVILAAAIVPVYFAFAGAFGIARPDSWWARHNYDEAKRGLARERFPTEVGGETDQPG